MTSSTDVVATVDNIGNGVSPTTQLGFMRPKGEFKVVKRGDVITVDGGSADVCNIDSARVTIVAAEGMGPYLPAGKSVE